MLWARDGQHERLRDDDLVKANVHRILRGIGELLKRVEGVKWEYDGKGHLEMVNEGNSMGR
jgi:hypothetical protein